MNKSHHNRKKRIKERMSHPTIYRANSCYASKWGLPKLEYRFCLEYPIRQRSLRSTPSKGKPCTWGRKAVSNINTNKGKCVRHYEKSRASIKHVKCT